MVEKHFKNGEKSHKKWFLKRPGLDGQAHGELVKKKVIKN